MNFYPDTKAVAAFHIQPPDLRGLLFAVIMLVASFFLTACDAEKLPALARDDLILAFGDSLTEGKGVNASLSYPAILEQLTGRIVLNRGISGETTAEGLKRLPAVLDTEHPELLILMHGGNDILRNHNLAKTKANLLAMIDEAHSRSITVILIGIPEKKLFSKTAPFYREVAEQKALILEDSIIASLLKNPSMKSDAVHFNERGYRAIAERIQELLEKSGAL